MAYDPKKKKAPKYRRTESTRSAADQAYAQLQYRSGADPSGEIVKDDGTVIKPGGGMAAGFNPPQGWVANPSYLGQGVSGDIFNPNNQIAALPVYSDPNLAKPFQTPLPQGRYVDPTIPSPLSAARMSEIEEYKKDPKKYVEDHAAELNQEESLIDKGKSMLGRIFDYQDEADLNIAGVNLSGVESVWDTSLKYMTGFYDVISVGLGGLASALPGGTETLSGEQLSNGRDFWQVLNGEMEGDAPSPGQIIVGGGAASAERLRNGDATIGDFLFNTPLMLAGLLAPESPLQRPGESVEDVLTNTAKREEAFGSGAEKWMSGITDFGLMFADPLIGAGIGLKVARAGALGAKGSVKVAAATEVATKLAVEEIGTKAGVVIDDSVIDEMIAFNKANAGDTTEKVVDRLIAGDPNVEPRPKFRGLESDAPEFWDDVEIPAYDNPLSTVIHRVVQRKRADGSKVLSREEIANFKEFKYNPQRAQLADMLYLADDPIEASLAIQAMAGSKKAVTQLNALSPALGDVMLRANFERMTMLRTSTEPQKIADARASLKTQKENLEQQRSNVTDLAQKRREALDAQQAKLAEGATPSPAMRKLEAEVVQLEERARVLERSVEEVDFLDSVVRGDKMPDILDTRNPFYDEATATRVADDMLRRQDFVTKALNAEIVDAAHSGRYWFATKANPYARMTTEHRLRSAKAATEYASEGTALVPHKVLTKIDPDGKQHFKTDWMPKNLIEIASEHGWGSREFAHEFRRNARVWRWMNTETPSGYIGLKGTSTVNSEREIGAALDLDLYKGDGVTVMQPNAAGVMEEVQIGGAAARRRYVDEFLAALNDPSKDSLEALKRIEARVTEDFAWAYYANNESGMNMVRGAAKKGDKLRDKTVEELRSRAFFVDPDDGSLQFAPYLKSQLANGTYMQNWHAMEKALKHDLKSRNGQKVGVALDTAVDYVAQADNLFQAFWRPATLMRFSYTQRNVFEGMLRAMAYNASLAPLTWPVRGTFNGVRNKVAKTVAQRNYVKATKALDDSSFAPVWDEYTKASQESHRYNTALEMTLDGDAEPMMYMFSKEPGKKGSYVKLTMDDYEAQATAAADRLAQADAALVANADKFTASVKGTKFGKWREKEIEAVKGRLVENEKALNVAYDLMAEPDAYDNLLRLDDNPFIVDRLSDLIAESDLLRRNLDDLTYRPVYATQMYRQQAGRARRIGSGTSIGPDGNAYHDAWNSPLDEINRGLMSADNTVKQSMSARGGLMENLFQRILYRDNRPIEYASNPAAWHAGMAGVIEDASSNQLIRVLLDNNWNPDEALRWMQSGDGRSFSEALQKLFSSTDSMGGTPVAATFLSNDAATASGKLTHELTELESRLFVTEPVRDPVTGLASDTEKVTRLRPFIQTTRDAAGKPTLVFDESLARDYIRYVSHNTLTQMQGIPAFHDMLMRRSAAKAGKETAGTAAITADDVAAVVDGLSPVDRGNLGYVKGSEMVQMGTNKFMDTWSALTNKVFHGLGTVPEDAIVRGPFYQSRYKAVRNELIESYWYRAGTTAKDIKKRRKMVAKSGREHADTIAHEAFQIPSDELSRIEVLSHRAALRDTKEWMYTIDRRTNVGKYGEFIFPFISASQNSAVTIGKLLYKEPWLAPLTVDLWRAPTRLGIEDEDGNISVPVPDAVVDFLNALPMTEGVLEKGQMLSVPKDGLNVMLPDSGFGPLPRPAVWVQVGASEMMKMGAFPVETPEVFKAIFPGDGADSAYQTLKDYIFGEQNTLSEKWMSWDKVLPASAQRIIEMKDELGPEYGYEFQLIYHSEMMKYRGGERDDKPSVEEIHKKTTNSFWMKFFGNLGVPVLSGMPGPVLTRPTPQRPAVTELQDLYKQMQTADPAGASLNMYNMFGEWGLEAALTKVTDSVGGAQPTQETVSDIRRYDSLIRKTTQTLTKDNYDLLSIIVNNRNAPESAYDESAYAWQKATTIPGTTDKFREVQSPEQANAERQRIVGWTLYKQTMDKLDAMLDARGLRSYEANGAEDLKNARNVYIANARNNPDLEGWWVEFSDAGGNRNSSSVRVLETAVQDDEFRRGMLESGKDLTLAAMDQYVYYRKGVVNAIHESGVGITDERNAWLKESWDTIRQDLKKSDVRFAEIFDMYLANDDNPQYAGGYYIDPNLDAYVRGEYVGNR